MVDYGTERHVELKDARILRQDFAKFPFQAIHGQLAGISVTEKFSLEARKIFQEMADLTHDLGGLVIQIQGKNESIQGLKYSLKVVDTVTNSIPSGKIINDIILKSGFGSQDISKDNFKFTYETPAKKIIQNVSKIRRRPITDRLNFSPTN